MKNLCIHLKNCFFFFSFSISSQGLELPVSAVNSNYSNYQDFLVVEKPIDISKKKVMEEEKARGKIEGS